MAQFLVLKNTTTDPSCPGYVGSWLGHAWLFGSLILTIIKILKLELLQCYNEMNSNCLLAFTEVMTHDKMRQSYAQSHSLLQWWFIADAISTETGNTVDIFYYKLEYFTEFYLFQAWTWRLTMLQIYVTCGEVCLFVSCVCVCVCACVYHCQST